MGPLVVLRQRDFRIFWLGQAISLTGTWMQGMGQQWVLTSMGSGAWVLGAFNVVGCLPMLILGARAGEMVDRGDKKRILLVTQFVMMALALSFATLVLSGLLQLWHIFVLCFLVGVTEAWEFPAAQSLAPELVPREQIPHAVGMMQAIFHTARLVGNALAGVMIARLGEGSAFLANGLSFIAVIVSLMLIIPRAEPIPPSSPPPGDGAHTASGGFREGLRYARTEPTVRALFLLLTLLLSLVMPVMVLLPYYAVKVLEVGPEAMGELMSFSGVGALAGTVVMVTSLPASWARRLWAGVALAATAVLGMASTTQLPLATGFVALLSLSTALTMGTITQTVQARVPAEMRGRVMALFGMIFTSAVPFASIIITVLVDMTDTQTLMRACGALYLVGGVVLLLRMPSGK